LPARPSWSARSFERRIEAENHGLTMRVNSAGRVARDARPRRDAGGHVDADGRPTFHAGIAGRSCYVPVQASRGIAAMSDLSVVLTVLLLYVAIVVSPGPNFALISRLALRGEDRAAWGATLGLATAATFYGVLAMVGLSALLQQLGWLTRIVQIGGGLYLAWLGVQAWRHAGSTTTTIETATGREAANERRREAMRGLRLGAMVNLSNPKAIAFFVSLYAVAVPPDAALWAKGMILASSFAIEIVWYGLVILALSTGRARRIYDRFGAWIERAIGTLLIAFGIRLAIERG
jgi:threonine/homoserine/homoserine lactone efflux protein